MQGQAFYKMRYGIIIGTLACIKGFLIKRSLTFLFWSDFRVFVDLDGTSTIDNSTTLTLDGLTTMKYFSGDGTTHSLGNYDNFTVGFKTRMDCSN